jgi:N-methylhydantoinase A
VVKPEPLVPYSLTEEVGERVDYAGRILVPVDEAEVKRAVKELLDRGVESLAISTLWSFRNPKNELAIKKCAQEIAPDLFVTISSELAPVMGEYERTTTVILNSYLGPILQNYCLSLQKRLKENGLRYPLLLMQSVGGLIPAKEAPQRAVTTLISGLEGGVIASQFMANDLGYKNAITTDMGGTSFEVGMIVDGNPALSLHPLTPRSR